MSTRKAASTEALTTFGAVSNNVDAVVPEHREPPAVEAKRLQALARAVAARRQLRAPGGATRLGSPKAR
jgi:hypothetical protein